VEGEYLSAWKTLLEGHNFCFAVDEKKRYSVLKTGGLEGVLGPGFQRRRRHLLRDRGWLLQQRESDLEARGSARPVNSKGEERLPATKVEG